MAKPWALAAVVFIPIALVGIEVKTYASDTDGAVKAIDAPFCECNIKIDGTIGESEWAHAVAITDIVQLQPRRGEAPTESTCFYLLYDRDNLYIGFKCFDDSSEIKASATIRDHESIGWDDGIVAIISPTGDKLTGYGFSVNALGTQRDYRLDEDGNVFDPEWDGIWESATRLTADRYEGEIRIPFSNFRFANDSGQWGLNILRGIVSKMEVDSWVLVSSASKISELGRLSLNLDKINYRYSHEDAFRLTPYFSQPLTRGPSKIGLENITYRISSGTSLQLTINPDYAQIEADVDEFNLDKLPIYLDEKRRFFIEEMALFETAIPLMYTRTMESIHSGMKLSARVGKTDVGILAVATRDEVAGATGKTEKVVSARIRNFHEPASLGVLGIANWNPSNQVLALDGSVSLPWGLHGSVQLAQSWIDGQRSKILHHTKIARNVNEGLIFELSHTHIPSDFEDVRGFLRMKNLLDFESSVAYRLFLNKYGIRLISPYLAYGSWQTEDHRVILEGGAANISVDFERNISLYASVSSERRIWQNTKYRNRLYSMSLSRSPGGYNYLTVAYYFGKYYGGYLHYPSLSPVSYTHLTLPTKA